MADRGKYDALWDEGRRAFREGTLRRDHAPADGDSRWGLSLVLLPPAPVAAAISAAAAELGGLYSGPHHVYQADDLHLTVTSLEPYRDVVVQTTIDHYIDAVERHQELAHVDVQLVGLGGSPSGVFVQGVDEDTLTPIRQLMLETAADLHGGVAPLTAFVRNTAHISISVHQQAGPEPSAADYVDKHRHTHFGRMCGAALALVRYRASGGAMRLEVLHSFR
ncbi:hypothetical protein [Curtobacterium flaccumfaciens]|uniref:hypothetical protein n=1 Tax=Curtobacterium flaccumfaciens TaxID=2035 RepID=UPI0021F9C1EE|nr:hypothetical protein [Curtobacterium flaccumfaciens]UWD79172.1 hypothetical protein NY058_17480 [Curtobacterium flaccumfaciens]